MKPRDYVLYMHSSENMLAHVLYNLKTTEIIAHCWLL